MEPQVSGLEIARKLNFSRSTICREINRSKATPIALAASYEAGVAQARSQDNRRAGAASRRKLGADTQSPLWRTVLSGLRCSRSPQQIAGKLPRMNKAVIEGGLTLPTQHTSVSHETIYCAIYAMPRSTLRAELVGLLRQSHKTRRPRTVAPRARAACPT